MTELEGWLLNKLREVEPEAQQEDIYTGKIALGGAWVMELIEEWYNKQMKKVKNIAYEPLLGVVISDEQITDKAISYAKEFEIRDKPIKTAKLQSNAVRDYYKGYKDCLNNA